MELTRNLYRLEEVRASFVYALLIGKTKEAVFWAEEILASECGHLLGEMLMSCWIWHCCPYDLGLLSRIRALDYENTCDESHIHVIMRLQSAMKKATSSCIVLSLLVAGTRLWPIGGNGTPAPSSQETKESAIRAGQTGLSAEVCHAITTFLQKGNVAKAWYFMSRADPSCIRRLIPFLDGSDHKSVEHLLVFSEIDEWCLPAFCAICCILGATDDQLVLFTKKSDYEADDVRNYLASLNSWDRKQGGRRGRIYAVDTAGLYGCTERGRLTTEYETITELYDIYPRLLEGTEFWKRVVAGYDISDDSQKEDFFDTWFPNDIPDEWSLEDQQKSHGDCILKGPYDPRTYIRTYFRPFMQSKYLGIYRKLMLEAENPLDFRPAYTMAKSCDPVYV